MECVNEVHDFHLWNLSDEKPILTAHVVSDDNPSFVLYQITEMLQKEFEIFLSTIQIEPLKHSHLKKDANQDGGLLKCLNEHNFVDKRKVLSSK